MARKFYSEDEVLRILSRKNDLKINPITKTIQVLSAEIYDRKHGWINNPKRKNDLGNGSWGKIDFLKGRCKYLLYYVTEF